MDLKAERIVRQSFGYGVDLHAMEGGCGCGCGSGWGWGWGEVNKFGEERMRRKAKKKEETKGWKTCNFFLLLFY